MSDDDELSFLSDSKDEKAVENILSQARDHSVLEQIAAINSSPFDHNLPSHLETRFRKLKSLPTYTTSTSASSGFAPRSTDDFEQTPNVLKSKTRNKSPSESESESETLSPHKYSSNSNSNSNSNKQKNLKTKMKSITTSFKSLRRSFSSLWSSADKETRKHGKENRSLSSLSSTSFGDFNDDEFLKLFSKKEQKKMMKRAMKEEEKINREADKIVKWAKQASDRMMNVSGLDHIEDQLSD